MEGRKKKGERKWKMEGGPSILPDRPASRLEASKKLLFTVNSLQTTDITPATFSSRMLTSSQLIELRQSGVRQDEKYICQHRIHWVGGSSHAALLDMFSIKLAAQKYHLGGLWKFNLANHGRWY